MRRAQNRLRDSGWTSGQLLSSVLIRHGSLFNHMQHNAINNASSPICPSSFSSMPDGQAHTNRVMYVSPDDIRTDFCAALSAMYRQEVPLYGDLIELVDEVNEEIRHQGGSWEVAGMSVCSRQRLLTCRSAAC